MKTLRSIILTAAAILAIGLTATTMHPTQIQASGPSACPDPGHCSCDPATGVSTDHAMIDPNGNLLPGAQINNGCTETGPF